MNPKIRLWMILGTVLMLLLAACGGDSIEPPTPFDTQPPNLTMTAIFAPTQALPTVTVEVLPTETPDVVELLPTATPMLETPTLELPTSEPTSTPATEISYAGPGARTGTFATAYYFSSPPHIDSELGDWTLNLVPVSHVVYGSSAHDGEDDLYATMMLGWDNSYLYLGIRVKDEKYVQYATGIDIFKGDSLEILIDTNVSGDYYLARLSYDDYQLGISPGSTNPGQNPEAYLWYPYSLSGPRDQVRIEAQKTGQGYQIEVAIPWSVFGVDPCENMHLGFAFSVSDNDAQGYRRQESMISNVPTRVLTDPTSWGDLILVKP